MATKIPHFSLKKYILVIDQVIARFYHVASILCLVGCSYSKIGIAPESVLFITDKQIITHMKGIAMYNAYMQLNMQII